MSDTIDLETHESKLESVYNERSRCIALILKMAEQMGFKTGLAEHPVDDESWDADWTTIAVVILPCGQLTWHIPIWDRYLFNETRHFEDDEYQWDGHTTEEKYNRMHSLTGDQIRKAFIENAKR